MGETFSSTNQPHHIKFASSFSTYFKFHKLFTWHLSAGRLPMHWLQDIPTVNIKDPIQFPSTHELFCYDEWSPELCNQPNRPGLLTLPGHQRHRAIKKLWRFALSPPSGKKLKYHCSLLWTSLVHESITCRTDVSKNAWRNHGECSRLCWKKNVERQWSKWSTLYETKWRWWFRFIL